MRANFNQRVYIYIMYWTDAEGQRMILNCVEYATGFPVLSEIEERRVQGILNLFERTWV